MSNCKRWKTAVKGWLRATEVTHNTDKKSASFDTFHPHLHLLLCVNSRYFKSADYIPQKEWKAMWEHYAKLDYSAQVNIKAVKDLDNDPTKLIEIVEIGKQLLMTRGTLTTFSIANDVAKYFAIVPALFMVAIPELAALNIMNLHSPESAILSAVIFNAIIIPILIPLALRGVQYKPIGASALLRRNLLIYGVGLSLIHI